MKKSLRARKPPQAYTDVTSPPPKKPCKSESEKEIVYPTQYELDTYDPSPTTHEIEFTEPESEDRVLKQINDIIKAAKEDEPPAFLFRVSAANFQSKEHFVSLMEKWGVYKSGVSGVIVPDGTGLQSTDLGFKDMKIEPPTLSQVHEYGKGTNLAVLMKTYKCLGRLKLNKFFDDPKLFFSEKAATADATKEPDVRTVKSVSDDLYSLLSDKKKYNKRYGLDNQINKMMPTAEFRSWDFDNMDTNIDDFKQSSRGIPGVHTNYANFGKICTVICFHHEDSFFYSCNFLQRGFSKMWYSIPLKYSADFEDLCARLFPDEFAKCKFFLQHKNIFVHPLLLKKNGIHVNIHKQDPGTLMITYPRGYHGGYNMGDNWSDSVNFGGDLLSERMLFFNRCICQKSEEFNLTFNHKLFAKTHFFNGDSQKCLEYLRGKREGSYPDIVEDKHSILCGPFGSFEGVVNYLRTDAEVVATKTNCALIELTHFLECEPVIAVDIADVLDLFEDWITIFRNSKCQLLLVLNALRAFVKHPDDRWLGNEIILMLLKNIIDETFEFRADDEYEKNCYFRALEILGVLFARGYADVYTRKVTDHLRKYVLPRELMPTITESTMTDLKPWLDGKQEMLRYLSVYIIRNGLVCDEKFWKCKLERMQIGIAVWKELQKTNSCICRMVKEIAERLAICLRDQAGEDDQNLNNAEEDNDHVGQLRPLPFTVTRVVGTPYSRPARWEPGTMCHVPGCGISFADVRSFCNHLYNKHGIGEAQEFRCIVSENCNFKSVEFGNLRKHMRGIHKIIVSTSNNKYHVRQWFRHRQ